MTYVKASAMFTSQSDQHEFARHIIELKRSISLDRMFSMIGFRKIPTGMAISAMDIQPLGQAIKVRMKRRR